MHRGEREPYNPYPEEGYGRGEEFPRRDHHHPHHPHHSSEAGPQHGMNLEHRPPPPVVYGDSAPPGYSEGPYGQERRSGPYEEQRAGGHEGYTDYRHGGYEDRRSTSKYPTGSYVQMDPLPGGYGAGHGYGSAEYNTSPYAPAPHHRARDEDEGPRRRQFPGHPVRIHCKADPSYNLAVVPGQGPVMVPTDMSDDYQVWYKDETISTRVTDETGAGAFSLINKATGQALRHAPEDLKQCFLTQYEPNGLDDTIWWTMSEDMGQGYRCIRLATDITRNMDVLRGDKKSGGVKEGSPVITFAWKKQDNQIWKMAPA